jgi:hypothetical protein
MKELPITLLSFADFWFVPLICLFLLSLIIEQIVMRVATSEMVIYQVMRIRRLLWQQNLFLNFIWTISYFSLILLQGKEHPKDPFLDSGILWR